MKRSWLALVLFLSTVAEAQKSDTLLRYFTMGLEPTTKVENSYRAFVYAEGDHWGARVINDSNRVLMTGSYRDKSLRIRDGLFTFYYPQGETMVRGRYVNNTQSGSWLAWHRNGRVKDSVFFLNGYKQGRSWGWHENGQLMHEGFFEQGQPDSSWTWYFSNGQPSTKERYRRGKLQSLECFDSTGKSMGGNCSIDVPPTIPGRYGGVEKYILDSLYYPKEAIEQNIQGIVDVQFTITKEGKLRDVRFLNAPEKILADEVYRVLMSVPAWYPAILHNQVVDFTQSIKIPFYRSTGGN